MGVSLIWTGIVFCCPCCCQTFRVICLRICGTIIMCEWWLFIWCCYAPLGVPVLKPISRVHYPNGGVAWFQGLFCNFVLLSGPERWLRKRFVKYGIPLSLWLLRRAVVVIFSRPGSGKSSWVNFRWLHSPSRFCFIVVVSWWCCGILFQCSKRQRGRKI